MKKIGILLIALVVSLGCAGSCASGVSQQEYDEVNNELVALQNQIASLQDRLGADEMLKAQNEELNKQNDAMTSELELMKSKYEELNQQNKVMMDEFETVRAEYQQLNSEYRELSKRCNMPVEEPAEIIEEEVEQAIFELINQDRKDNGLDELIWGVNIYKVAQSNNRDMATNQKLVSPPHGAHSEAYWATGYTETDTLAEAVFTVWKNNRDYELEFLNSNTGYGTVAVYKSGEIFYISYISDIFR
jgi:hypothetical protein